MTLSNVYFLTDGAPSITVNAWLCIYRRHSELLDRRTEDQLCLAMDRRHRDADGNPFLGKGEYAKITSIWGIAQMFIIIIIEKQVPAIWTKM